MYITEIENKIEDLKNRIREWNEPLLIIRAEIYHASLWKK